MAVEVSLKKLLETGAHFGHQSRRWNPKMKPYLYTVQDGVHVFDLVKTKKLLDEALEALKDAGSVGKAILIVGTKRQAKEKVAEVAKSAGIFSVTERWLGGTLTNFEQMKKSTRKLTEMKAKMEAGEYKSYTKKERLLIEREIARLERFFGGIAGMDEIPSMLVVVDIKREAGAVKEAVAMGAEVIAIVDSNSDPTLVDYAIPMNDDATRAIEYVLGLIQEAILEGKKKKSKKSVTGKSKSSSKKT